MKSDATITIQLDAPTLNGLLYAASRAMGYLGSSTSADAQRIAAQLQTALDATLAAQKVAA